MWLRVDKERDALYFWIDETAVVRSEEVRPGVILDYDAKDNVVGMAILTLSKRIAPERLRGIKFETV